MRIQPRKKVLVGMSGGVDSSVSAALLLEQGYEVIGAFMRNWSETKRDPSTLSILQGRHEDDRRATGSGQGGFKECGWREERRDAMRVAAKLGIPFVTFDFEAQYRDRVVENMYKEYAAGRTPNPDVLCNKYVKFDLFVKEADRLGCEFVATGHYARIESCDPATLRPCAPKILAGSDPNKDQTYFLWAIPKEVLPRVLFPVGGMLKSEVREKARALGLPTADKKDSTGICFVGEVDIRAFLKERIPEDPGDIVTTTGEVVGTHEGVAFYTIGQRHGLNVGGGMPYYVVNKKLETKQLIVSSNFHPRLFGKMVAASQANWFRQPSVGDRVFARVRYRQPLQGCTIATIDGDRVTVEFDEPVRAVTPGQSIVFYDGEEMLGGAIIQ